MNLALTFSEIDEVFLRAFQRSLDLLSIQVAPNSENWKINLRISVDDKESYEHHIRIATGISDNTDSLVRFWRLAIDFLIYENSGFPGRKITGFSNAPFPHPEIYSSGFSNRMLEIEKLLRIYLLRSSRL